MSCFVANFMGTVNRRVSRKRGTSVFHPFRSLNTIIHRFPFCLTSALPSSLFPFPSLSTQSDSHPTLIGPLWMLPFHITLVKSNLTAFSRLPSVSFLCHSPSSPHLTLSSCVEAGRWIQIESPLSPQHPLILFASLPSLPSPLPASTLFTSIH